MKSPSNFNWLNQKPPRGAKPDLAQPLSKGLVGCWLFNERSGSTIRDTSVFRNNGALANPPLWVGGKYGPALHVQAGAGNRILVGTTIKINSDPQGSISAWIKPTGTFANESIFAVGCDGSDNGLRVGIYQSTNFYFTIYDRGTGDQVRGDTILVANQWYHVVFTADNTTGGWKIYLDGKLETIVVNAGANTGIWFGGVSLTGALSTRIADARRASTEEDVFSGQISHIYLYNRALTAEDVTQLYSSPFQMFQAPAIRRYWSPPPQPPPAVAAIAPINPQKFKWANRKPGPGAQVNWNHPLSRKVIGWWLLNEGAGTTVRDLSPSKNHGTLTNSPTWTTGKFGRAITLGGSEANISIGSSPVYNFTSQDFAISFWVKAPASGQNAGAMLMARGVADEDGWYLQVDSAANKDGLSFVCNASGNTVSAPAIMVLDKWTHIVFTRNQGVASYYQNGSFRVSGSYLAADTSTHSLFIGRYDTDGFSFKGGIDDVRIYDRSLSAGEIQQLYSDPFANFLPPGIKRRWWDTAAGAGATVTGVLTAAGTGDAAWVGASTFASTWSAAGTSTASWVGSETAASALTAAGTSAAAWVGAETAESVLTAAGTGVTAWVAAGGAASVWSAAGTSDGTWVGASSNESVLSASGTSAAAWVSAFSLQSVWSAAGTSSVSWVPVTTVPDTHDFFFPDEGKDYTAIPKKFVLPGEKKPRRPRLKQSQIKQIKQVAATREPTAEQLTALGKAILPAASGPELAQITTAMLSQLEALAKEELKNKQEEQEAERQRRQIMIEQIAKYMKMLEEDEILLSYII